MNSILQSRQTDANSARSERKPPRVDGVDVRHLGRGDDRRMLRDSFAGPGPMQMDSSATQVRRAAVGLGEDAHDSMPSSRQAR